MAAGTARLAGFACCTPSPNEKGTAVPCLFHLGVIYEKDTKFYEGAKTDEGVHFCTRGCNFNEWVQIDSLQTIKPHLHYNINIEKLLLKSNLFHDFFL